MKVRTPTTNDYPTSDGRPVAETDLHRALMFETIDILQAWFADVPDAYVSGNLLLFYAQGDRRRHVAPDVFVSFGVGKHERNNYLVWEEGPPAIAIELTSSSTHREDLTRKFELYRDVLGIAEYILFDPREDYLRPSLQGYRLVNGEYRPMRLQHGRLRSRSLGLWLERDGTRLCFIDPANDERLLPPVQVERERADVAEEERDTAVEERDAIAGERDTIAEQRDDLAEKNDALTEERDAAVQERDAAMDQRAVIAEERDVAVQERDAAMDQRAVIAKERDSLANERAVIAKERDDAVEEREAMAAALKAAQEELAEMRRQKGKPSS